MQIPSFRLAALALASLLALPFSAAADSDLRAVRVLYDDQGGAGRALELEFSRPIAMRDSRFYISDAQKREFVPVLALPRDASSPTRIFVVIGPDVGSSLLVRWFVRSADGQRSRGQRDVRLEPGR